MKKFLKNYRLHLVYIVVILISVFLITKNFLQNDLIIGDDIKFHINRILGFSNFWKSPVNFNIFENQGKGVGLFYPSYFFYITHIFYHFTHSIFKSIKYYNLVVVLVGSIMSYYAAFKYYKNEHKSGIFTVLFMSSQYFLTNMYLRYAFGETSAMAFIPLVLFGFYFVFFGNSKLWYILALGLVCISNTHMLSIIMLATVGLIIFVISFIFNKEIWNKNRFIHLLILVVVTVLSSLMITGPMIEQLIANKYFTAFQPLTFSRVTTLYKYFELTTDISLISYSIGPVILGLFIFNMVIFKKLNKFEKILLIMSLILMIMQTNIFPWKLFDSTKFLVIQFPFRLNSITTACNVLIFSNQIVNIFEKEKHFFVSLSVIVVQLIILVSTILNFDMNVFPNFQGKNTTMYSTYKPRKSEKEMLKLAKSYKNNDYTNYLKTYDKLQMVKSNFVKYRASFISKSQSKKLHSTNWYNITLNGKKLMDKPKYTDDYLDLLIKEVTKNDSKLVLPITLYKGIKVIVNNKIVLPKVYKNGATEINVPSGKNVNIKVNYEWTTLARISQIVGFSSLILLLMYIVKVEMFSKTKI